MHIRPGENAQIARLLGFLTQGERLAETCAVRQAALTSQPGMQRFLMAQSRQEALHAAVFENAAIWLAPARKSAQPVLISMQHYQAHIDAALAAYAGRQRRFGGVESEPEPVLTAAVGE